MKASDKMVLNGYVVSGYIRRVGERYIIDPWAFSSADEYELLVKAMVEDYNFNLSEAGLIVTRKQDS